jgi:hypothetical protein
MGLRVSPMCLRLGRLQTSRGCDINFVLNVSAGLRSLLGMVLKGSLPAARSWSLFRSSANIHLCPTPSPKTSCQVAIHWSLSEAAASCFPWHVSPCVVGKVMTAGPMPAFQNPLLRDAPALYESFNAPGTSHCWRNGRCAPPKKALPAHPGVTISADGVCGSVGTTVPPRPLPHTRQGMICEGRGYVR